MRKNVGKEYIYDKQMAMDKLIHNDVDVPPLDSGCWNDVSSY